jgi:hypothetical protein
MRTPQLSTASSPAPISSPRARNHLPFEALPTASVDRRHVTISTSLPPSGAIGDNSEVLLSLSLSYHDDLLSPGASRGPVIHRLNT